MKLAPPLSVLPDRGQSQPELLERHAASYKQVGESMLCRPKQRIEAQNLLKQTCADIPMSVRAIRDHYYFIGCD